MSTSFPTSLDDFTNPSGSQSLASGGHSQLHSDLNDAVEAIQAKVGVDASAVVTSHDYLLAQLAGNLLLGAGEVSVTDAVEATIGRMHVCSGTAADYTVTLPAAAGNANKLIGFRMSPLLTRFVTLVGYDEPGTGTGSIDHASSRVLWANESAILFCDGADWFKVAGKSRPMACGIYLSGGHQTGVTSGTVVKAALNAVDFDTTGLMADTLNNRIVCRRPGLYRVSGAIKIGGTTGGTGLNANASRAVTRLMANGSAAAFAEGECSGLTGGFPTSFTAKDNAWVAGDYFELKGFQNSGSDGHFYGFDHITQLTAVEVPQW